MPLTDGRRWIDNEFTAVRTSMTPHSRSSHVSPKRHRVKQLLLRQSKKNVLRSQNIFVVADCGRKRNHEWYAEVCIPTHMTRRPGRFSPSSATGISLAIPHFLFRLVRHEIPASRFRQ